MKESKNEYQDKSQGKPIDYKHSHLFIDPDDVYFNLEKYLSPDDIKKFRVWSYEKRYKFFNGYRKEDPSLINLQRRFEHIWGQNELLRGSKDKQFGEKDYVWGERDMKALRDQHQQFITACQEAQRFMNALQVPSLTAQYQILLNRMIDEATIRVEHLPQRIAISHATEMQNDFDYVLSIKQDLDNWVRENGVAKPVLAVMFLAYKKKFREKSINEIERFLEIERDRFGELDEIQRVFDPEGKNVELQKTIVQQREELTRLFTHNAKKLGAMLTNMQEEYPFTKGTCKELRQVITNIVAHDKTMQQVFPVSAIRMMA